MYRITTLNLQCIIHLFSSIKELKTRKKFIPRQKRIPRDDIADRYSTSLMTHKGGLFKDLIILNVPFLPQYIKIMGIQYATKYKIV
ncbi:MAG: hypothetical protein CBB68_04810 [Rhodospirillaceae bacterium TMED8]|nr:hypothetical protein [Magnetovibrio sp.]OUT51651.1 MAG: hypothetical protein CBB68_04810 [Rhodospirillaceae bacterium TMED8]